MPLDSRPEEPPRATVPIVVNGATLLADPMGAAIEPQSRTLIVADLHFEKGSGLARRGRLLPPYDTRATLERLARLIDRWQPRRVVALGDSFHDRGAGERIAAADLDALGGLMRGRDWIWVRGNHDPEPPARIGGDRAGEVRIGPMVLRHQPEGDGAGEVCGHFHPKASVRLRAGRLVSGRCFAGDARRLVLPSFGAYTGGLDVLDPALSGLFRGAFAVVLIGRDRLYRFTSARLRGGAVVSSA
jgi:DNA ligase-associated metallophosphoesterase